MFLIVNVRWNVAGVYLQLPEARAAIYLQARVESNADWVLSSIYTLFYANLTWHFIFRLFFSYFL
jgi:hypothetical protein